MKKKIVWIIIGLMLQSCVSNKYMSSTTSIDEVDDMGYFEPYAYIQLINKGNRAKLNDSVSAMSKRSIDSVLQSNMDLYNIKNKIVIEDSVVNQKVEKELAFLIQSVMVKRTLKGVKLTPVIDSILEARNQRFALGVVGTGFARRKGNYGGQVAKGVAVGVLTLGFFVPVPIKSNLSLYFIILDAQKDDITFYTRTFPIEKPPTDPRVIKQQLDKIYQDYLFEKK